LWVELKASLEAEPEKSAQSGLWETCSYLHTVITNVSSVGVKKVHNIL